MIEHTLLIQREQAPGRVVPSFRVNFSAFELNEMEAQKIYRHIADLLDGDGK